MVKQQQYKTARERTSIGSNYNVAVVPEIEDKHQDIKNRWFYLNAKTKTPKLKSQLMAHGSNRSKNRKSWALL